MHRYSHNLFADYPRLQAILFAHRHSGKHNACGGSTAIRGQDP